MSGLLPPQGRSRSAESAMVLRSPKARVKKRGSEEDMTGARGRPSPTLQAQRIEEDCADLSTPGSSAPMTSCSATSQATRDEDPGPSMPVHCELEVGAQPPGCDHPPSLGDSPARSGPSTPRHDRQALQSGLDQPRSDDPAESLWSRQIYLVALRMGSDADIENLNRRGPMWEPTFDCEHLDGFTRHTVADLVRAKRMLFSAIQETSDVIQDWAAASDFTFDEHQRLLAHMANLHLRPFQIRGLDFWAEKLQGSTLFPDAMSTSNVAMQQLSIRPFVECFLEPEVRQTEREMYDNYRRLLFLRHALSLDKTAAVIHRSHRCHSALLERCHSRFIPPCDHDSRVELSASAYDERNGQLTAAEEEEEEEEELTSYLRDILNETLPSELRLPV